VIKILSVEFAPCGIACSSQEHKTTSGTCLIDQRPANVCEQNVTCFSCEIKRLAEDIADMKE
jgi:4-hydroxybutyryl-CoA dehydratase / vinylacetyl-CoA-Delta-isomerase